MVYSKQTEPSVPYLKTGSTEIIAERVPFGPRGREEASSEEDGDLDKAAATDQADEIPL